MSRFQLVSGYSPTGDQPQAIEELVQGIASNQKRQILLGVTGSGKTFTIANLVQRIQKPTLIISHNKTLAAQLYGEFKQYFPNNAVEYFISYYDYYQPEAYIPGKDIFIEKDADINKAIDKLRLRATMSLMEREDVLIVASVSCIYGLGVPQEYRRAHIRLRVGESIGRDELLRRLVDINYGRNDIAFERGTFRVQGDTVDIFPAYQENCIRVEFFGDEIEHIRRFNAVDNHILEEMDNFPIYPANHFVMSGDTIAQAVPAIQNELDERVKFFLSGNRFIEAQRIEERTKYDLEMLKELGYCSGIENYSRHLTGAAPGDPPFCLIDYFPEDFLLVIDESHASIPQINGMYGGDFTRKKNLIEYGFRLPSAFDNRPLRSHEFERKMPWTVFVSATPGNYELNQTEGVVVEQVIRPTGLIDPEIIIKPVATQVDDLLEQIRQRIEINEKVLVTTLTKRMAEDLSQYLIRAGIRARYMHSDIDTIQRSKIIRDFRLNEFDVLVGINLLREGLDLPEVSLVAILDADKVGFLRSTRSLIQTAGRAARNANGRVIFYADSITDSIRETVNETNRRREKQMEYNRIHGIVPKTIFKTMDEILAATSVAEGYGEYEPETKGKTKSEPLDFEADLELDTREKIVTMLKKEMRKAAEKLDFERAADLRDRIIELEGA
jgi:excinuclease ABC subunit B